MWNWMQAKRRRFEMDARSRLAAVAVMTVLLIFTTIVGFLLPAGALGSKRSGSVTIPESGGYTSLNGSGNPLGFGSFKLEGGGYANCAQQDSGMPFGRTFTSSTPIVDVSAAELGCDPHAFAWLAAHLPLGGSVDGGYGFTGDENQLGAVCCTAVWLIQGMTVDGDGNYVSPGKTKKGNLFHWSEGDPDMRGRLSRDNWPRVQKLVADARTHAGESGWWDGSATYWHSGDGSIQNIITFNPVEPTVEVRFSKSSADASFTEGNAEYSYAGAVYDIFDAATDTKVATITTDDAGHASCKLAPNTSYYAIETKAPAGFKLNAQRIDFTTGAGGSDVTLTDEPGSMTLKIRKRDSATNGTPQAGLTLAGAEYRVVSLSTSGWEMTGTTDGDGHLTLNGIPLGRITVTETKAPAGYKLDATPHTYEVKAGQINDAGVFELTPQDDFKEDVIAFDLTIAKTKGTTGEDAGGMPEPAAGVKFDIISNTTERVVGTLTTNENGFASTGDAKTVNPEAVAGDKTYDASKPWMGDGKRCEGHAGALPYDEKGYTIREVPETVPEGFDRVDDWIISADQMADGANLQFSVVDEALSSKIQIVKVDATSGLTVPLSGFSFNIVDAAGNKVTLTEADIDTFSTDGYGVATLPERLPSGTYRVREASAQPPYLLNGDPVPFKVSGNHTDIQPITVVRVSDMQAYGIATIRKWCANDECPLYGEAPADVDEPRGQVNGLAGAEFDVVAQEDIISPDGTIQAVAGEVVDHVTTDETGAARTSRLPLGDGTATYAFVETRAPEGHLLDTTPIEFILTWKDDETDVVYTTVAATNDHTKVDFSKQEVSGKGEIEGAQLSVLDTTGRVIEQWVSGADPHRINALEPGNYVLREDMTPRGYDKADDVAFTVKSTGDIQQVIMHDTPIEISGEIDKRQEIADPVADDHEENGDGKNKVDVTVSEDGAYDYSLDYRSTSNTWTDEFTVEDPLEAVRDGLTELTGITTAQAWQDYDGLMNVWYTTNLTPSDYMDDSGANATLSDNHANPWLFDDSNAERLGDDGRAVDYTGWRLWKEGVNTTEATNLEVADLELGEGEKVTGVRFEYGRVEQGFTTRMEAWDREDLKSDHDDLNDITPVHEEMPVEVAKYNVLTRGDGTVLHMDDEELEAARDGAGYLVDPDGDGTSEFIPEERMHRVDARKVSFAPVILYMKVTEDYIEGTRLDNSANVSLYRNGGGEGLEDHDGDQVTQRPKRIVPSTPSENLAQTGDNLFLLALCCAAAAVVTGGLGITRRPSRYMCSQQGADECTRGDAGRLRATRETSHDLERR